MSPELGMNSNAPVGGLNALDRLEGRSGCIFHALFNGHGTADGACGIDTCSLCLIGKADVV